MISFLVNKSYSQQIALIGLFAIFCFVGSGLYPSKVSVAFQDDGDKKTETETEEEEKKEKEEPSDEKKVFPKLDEMRYPTAKELLQNPPVDWIVLNNNDVVVVEPVTPRPDTLSKLEKKIEAIRKQPRPQDEEGRTERKEQLKTLQSLEIILIDGGEEPEFQINIKDIQKIIYHEDMLLRRIRKLLDEGAYRQSHEMFFTFIRKLPNWPGMDKTRQKLLFFEAKDRLKRKKPQEALAYLEDLHSLNKDYPQLTLRLGEINDILIGRAVKENNFQQARYFLVRFLKLESKHPIALKWMNFLKGQSQKFYQQALLANKKSEHAKAAISSEQAINRWEKVYGLRDDYRRFQRRFQRVHVGVLHFHNDPTPYFLPTTAQLRHRRLTTAMLFELDYNDKTSHYRSSLLEQWEPTDLGRKAVFKLKQKLTPWESRPIITASDAVSALSNYIDPQSKHYDEQFASYVRSLKVLSPFEFQVQFSRVPYRIEPLFQKPILADAQQETDTTKKKISTSLTQQQKLLSQRFHVVKQEADHIIYRRTHPEINGLPKYHVAEITEVKLKTHEQALQSLFRGKVSMLSTIPTRFVDQLKDLKAFTIRKYSLPVTHVIQINPRSKVLKNHELRRALAYSLNRKKLLSEVVLQDPEMKYGRIISAPYAKNSYAYHNLMKPRPYDLALGYTLSMLVKSSKKKAKKKIPTLKMLVPPDPIAQEVATKIVERWKKIGIPVVIVNDPQFKTDANSDQWDIIYRTSKMSEPATDLWPYLILGENAKVESLRHLPDWLRQELVDLDSVSNYEDIIVRLHTLHKHLQTEAFLIPLWEVDDFMIMNNEISGFPARPPVSLYQNVEKWIQIKQ
ncbi:hypothetical protein MNBD_PLANCTO02-1714 [hydrothermal vent metagenome]|uniref:Solute-binding protein family 5 domain-containing protein n=1 Tax=hydrothermal vent metagenome TaxID=652676 RepID=A0A3B1D9J3_9ZZZZ